MRGQTGRKANVGRCCPDLGQTRPESNWPPSLATCQHGPSSTQLGNCETPVRRVRPTHNRKLANIVELGPSCAQPGRIRPMLVDTDLGHHRRRLANTHPNRPEFAELGPELGSRVSKPGSQLAGIAAATLCRTCRENRSRKCSGNFFLPATTDTDRPSARVPVRPTARPAVRRLTARPPDRPHDRRPTARSPNRQSAHPQNRPPARLPVLRLSAACPPLHHRPSDRPSAPRSVRPTARLPARPPAEAAGITSPDLAPASGGPARQAALCAARRGAAPAR